MILASFFLRVSQKGFIVVYISNHKLIFCTRKISHLKSNVIYKYLNFRSFKNYAVDSHKETFKQPDFGNYESFDGVNRTYSNFFQKVMTVVDKIALYRFKWVKGNTQKWFDCEVLKKLNAREKLFKKFKKSRHSDKELYKKAKY